MKNKSHIVKFTLDLSPAQLNRPQITLSMCFNRYRQCRNISASWPFFTQQDSRQNDGTFLTKGYTRTHPGSHSSATQAQTRCATSGDWLRGCCKCQCESSPASRACSLEILISPGMKYQWRINPNTLRGIRGNCHLFSNATMEKDWKGTPND